MWILELGKAKGLLRGSRASTKYVYLCFRMKKNGRRGVVVLDY